MTEKGGMTVYGRKHIAVTSLFVHPLGLYVNLTFAAVKSVTFPVAVDLLALTFPAWSFTHT